MKIYRRREHRIIAEALSLMRSDFLLENQCWFGGGTAIVLKLDEYRQSADVDLLCADQDGYRELRQAAQRAGVAAFFDGPVAAVREMRTDQYGIRTVLQFAGQVIKFEIVREARIEIGGDIDPELGVPLLNKDSMFAEKLLANADRCMDRAVAYRDAIDLGMLLSAYGQIPPAALLKAEKAYGDDIPRKLIWSAARLQQAPEQLYSREALQMNSEDVGRAVASLTTECLRLWPERMLSELNSQK